MFRAAVVLLAGAAPAGAFTPYCQAVKEHLKSQGKNSKPYFMCASVPTGSAQATSGEGCAHQINGGNTQISTLTCTDFCATRDAVCVDGSRSTQGKTCPSWGQGSPTGCGVVAGSGLKLMCVCQEYQDITPSPTSSTPSPTTKSPTSSTPSPTSSTPSPTAPTTPAPTTATPAPTSSPTSSTPSPTSSTPSPTSTTPSPTSSTPSPTSTTPSPTSSTPSPTSTTPSPTSSTPSPTSTTPSPTSSTPSPTSSTPSPSSSTPSPTSSTPSPTSSTPAPTMESLSGDPFTSFGGKKTQFYLPAGASSDLLRCGEVELSGRAKNSGVPGDDQQWFDLFQVRLNGKEALTVTVRNTTGLLPEDASDAKAEEAEEQDDLAVVQRDAVAAALARLRSEESASGAGHKLTTLAVRAEGEAMHRTGNAVILGGSMNVTVAQDKNKQVGTGYVEVVEIRAADIGMKMQTSVAGKFTSVVDRILNTHIDVSFTSLDNMGCLAGMLPEIWGVKPMSTATAKVLVPPTKSF